MSFKKTFAGVAAGIALAGASGIAQGKDIWEEIEDPRVCKIALFTPDLTTLNCETVFAILANMRRAGVPMQHVPTTDGENGEQFNYVKHMSGSILANIYTPPSANMCVRPKEV